MDNPMDAPQKGELLRDLGRGVTLRAAAEGNEAWLLAHLREGDQAEAEAAEREASKCATDVHELYVREVYIWVGDELLGRWVSMLQHGQDILSRARFWAFETTDVATRHWRLFVRLQREVWRIFWTLEHPWVTEVYSITLQTYEKAMRWIQKSFGASAAMVIELGGEAHTCFKMTRPIKED
jgi:hypothetical protein